MKLTYVESVGIKKLEQYEKTVEFVDDDGVEDQVINVYPQVKYQVMCFSSWIRSSKKDFLRCIFIRTI